MKYLAILKDSFRETIATKVFTITVSFSCALTLAIASLSYRPLPAQEALQQITNRFSLVFADRGRSAVASSNFAIYEVQNLRQLNQAVSPPAGNYSFTLRVHDNNFREAAAFWNLPAATDARPRSAAARVSDCVMEEFLKSQYALHGNVEVTHVRRLPAVENHTLLFEVQTKGTSSARRWPHELCLFFGALALPLHLSPEVYVFWIEDSLVQGVGAWVGILAGIVTTAFFIPNMLEKGRLELLLVKPVRRTGLLVYKYLGGLTFVFLNAAVAVVGVWLAVGVRTGIWTTGFLLSVFVVTLFFATLYAVSTLVGVLTRSATVATVMTVAIWLLLWMVDASYASLKQNGHPSSLPDQFKLPQALHASVEVAHWLLPRTKELDRLTTKLLSHELLSKGELRHYRLDSDVPSTWALSISGSLAFIGVLLGLSAWRFATADY